MCSSIGSQCGGTRSRRRLAASRLVFLSGERALQCDTLYNASGAASLAGKIVDVGSFVLLSDATPFIGSSGSLHARLLGDTPLSLDISSSKDTR